MSQSHILQERTRTIMKSYILCALALLAAVVASACGTVATPEWAAEAQATRVAQVATSDYLTSIAPTFTPTPTPTLTPTPTFTPTETPVPTETPTPLPPTETPIPPTPEPDTDPVAVALAAGNPANGQAVFQAQHSLPDGSAWACQACHSVDPSGLRLIGPGLWNVANRDYLDEVGETAPEYIRNSILHPQDYIAPSGDTAWALNMPAGWDVVLSEQEVNDLVAYLLTLQS
jgi:mono/diheme cytochrome c family protein